MSEYAGTSRDVPPRPPPAPPGSAQPPPPGPAPSGAPAPSAEPSSAGPSSGASRAARPPVGDRVSGAAAPDVVHEAYSFACMRCGHGWEESYDIAHHRDAGGRPYVVYYAHGRRVPSPLTRPSCTLCGGSVVRIMRSGRVHSVGGASQFEQAVPMAGPLFVPEAPAHGPVPPSPLSGAVSEQGTPQPPETPRPPETSRPPEMPQTPQTTRPPETRGAAAARPDGERAGEAGRHRHLSDLLHVFQRGRR